MSVLKHFSEKEIACHQYQARQNYLREQSAIKADLLYERMAKEAALADKDVALAEIESLKQQLANKKIKLMPNHK